jgi:hypothetical protein
MNGYHQASSLRWKPKKSMSFLVFMVYFERLIDQGG